MKNMILLFIFFIFFLNSNNVSAEELKEIVYVEDFGAYGDGIHDDSIAINNALNSGAKVVIFKKDSNYKLKNYVIIETSDVSIIGNNATLFTDNDYRSRDNYYEWFFNVVANNIIINSLNIEARETILVGYKTQFTVRYASNVTVENCKFTIPETVLSDASTRDIEYSNIDIFTGWHNIFINDCIITQLADTEAGVNINFRDIWNAGCDTAIFTNNTCISNSHDEILALFSLEENTINNIKISKNIFKAIKGSVSNPRNVGITLGYCVGGDGGGINGVEFTENTLNIFSDYVLFLIGNSRNVNISNNTINYNAISSKNIAYLARGVTDDNLIKINNNNINIFNEFGGLVDGKIYFEHNTVKSNSEVTDSLFKEEAITSFNDIEINNKIKRIGYNIYKFKENKIKTDYIFTMFEFFNKRLFENIYIKNNIINIVKCSLTQDTFIMLNGTELNNFIINLINNKINMPSESNNKMLLYINIQDRNKQEIIFKNNKLGKYTLYFVNKDSIDLCRIIK